MTFGEKVVQELRQFRWRNKEMNGDAFWAEATKIIQAEWDAAHPDEPEAMPKLKPMTRARVHALNVALASGCGYTIAAMTEALKRACAMAVLEIRRACPDVAPPDIASAVRRYRNAHPTWACTPSSIAKYWAEFPPEQLKADIYHEPAGWRQSDGAMNALHVSRDSWQLICERPWLDLGPDIRATILRHTA